MRRITWLYIIGVILSALALSMTAFVHRPVDNPPVWLFASLTAVATLQRVFRIVAPGNKAYESSTISLFAGALLLPSWLFILVVVIAHTLEWVKERLLRSDNLRAWYIQPFNMAKCVIAGVATHTILILVPTEAAVSFSTGYLIVILASIFAYVTTNQLLLGMALFLARGVSFREAGILRDAVLMEIPLACIGYVATEIMNRSPLAALFVLAPIALIYQAFMLPKTQDEAMKALEGLNKELTEANQSISRLNEELFQALAKVFDMRDPFVGGHAAQVATYAVAIATEMGLSSKQTELVRQSAFLHDIGKLSIPEVILHKPGKLNETEYEFIKKHSDIGADLLASTEGLQHLAPFVRHHHERWDGNGYPSGLVGEDIPLEARILNLCDSIEAMASDRPYHRSMSTQTIIEEVRNCAGAQFDPLISEVFITLVQRIGKSFVVNSARSVTQQYAASILANESLMNNMFAWVLEGKAINQCTNENIPLNAHQAYKIESKYYPQQSPGSFQNIRQPLDI